MRSLTWLKRPAHNRRFAGSNPVAPIFKPIKYDINMNLGQEYIASIENERKYRDKNPPLGVPPCPSMKYDDVRVIIKEDSERDGFKKVKMPKYHLEKCSSCSNNAKKRCWVVHNDDLKPIFVGSSISKEGSVSSLFE